MEWTLLISAVVMAAARGMPTGEDSLPDATPPESRLGGTLGSALLQGLTTTTPPRPDFLPEDACNRAGGLCLHVDECPDGKLAAKPGLCPKQRSKGAECCHGISTLKKQCAQRSGVCRPSAQCARNLRDDTATDCPAGESCCVLVAL